MGDAHAALPPDLAQAIQRVREDRTHGASWLAREAARALGEASREGVGENADAQLRHLRAAAHAFAEARPSMAAIANTAARVWAAAGAIPAAPPDARLRAAHAAAQSIQATWAGAAEAILTAARPLLAGAILTHSRSGTVEEVLSRLAVEAEKKDDGARHAFVTESRPGGEGVSLARTLAAAGWRVTLIADAAVGYFMRQASVVVLGADSVREEGSVINKIGSYPTALAAREARVPVYVLCETLKITAPDFLLRYEEMDPDELLPDPPPGVTPRNVYFDRTPADLITGIITEAGALAPGDVHQIAREASAALAMLRQD